MSEGNSAEEPGFGKHQARGSPPEGNTTQRQRGPSCRHTCGRCVVLDAAHDSGGYGAEAATQQRGVKRRRAMHLKLQLQQQDLDEFRTQDGAVDSGVTRRTDAETVLLDRLQ